MFDFSSLISTLSFSSASTKLILTHDYFVLRAALVRKNKDKIEVFATAESSASHPEDAVEEVIIQLEKTQKKLPKQAFIASAAVVVGHNALPISPKKPKPYNDMQKLVGFELAEMAAENSEHWSIGSVLYGMGFISEDQRLEIINEISQTDDRFLQRSAQHFGQIAIDKGFVTNSQFEEAIRHQEELSLVDDKLVCAWQGYIEHDETKAESNHWFYAGVGHVYRNLWVKAFNAKQITLKAFLPMHSLPIGLIYQDLEPSQTGVLFEQYTDMFYCYRFKKDDLNIPVLTHVLRQKLENAKLDEAALSSICHLSTIDQDADNLYLSAPLAQNTDGACAFMQSHFSQAVINLDSRYENLNEYHIHELIAQNIFAKNSPFLLQIQANDPKPPIWKNFELIRFLIVIVIIVGIIANEVYMQTYTSERILEIKSLKKDTTKSVRLKEAMARASVEKETLNVEIEQLKEQLNDKDSEIEAIQKVENIASKTIRIFELLSSVVGEDIMLDSFQQLENDDKNMFHLKGWAITDAGARRFIEKLNRALLPFEYTVQSEQIILESNRYGEEGSGFDLWIVETKKKDQEQQAK